MNVERIISWNEPHRFFWLSQRKTEKEDNSNCVTDDENPNTGKQKNGKHVK